MISRASLDSLRRRQPWIQRSLARRHLRDGTLVLYDVTSSDFEGRAFPLAAFGCSRDRKQGKRQIVRGLLCAADGCPVAVEVFAGNTADPATVRSQVRTRRALAGDRGTLTTARIREDLAPLGIDWMSALKSSDIRKLLQRPAPSEDDLPGEPLSAPLQPGKLLPDQMAEILSPGWS